MTDTTGTSGRAGTADQDETTTPSPWWPPGVARHRTPTTSIGQDDGAAGGAYGVYDRLDPHLAMLRGIGA